MRKAASGPDHEWAEQLPQRKTGAREPWPYKWIGERVEGNYVDTQKHLSDMESDDELKFLRDCSPHLSSYISAMVLQDLRNGLKSTQQSVDKALNRAVIDGLPSLQLDAQQVLDTQRRTGRLVDKSPHHNELTFGRPADKGEYVVAPVRIAQTIWEMWDYGDTIPTVAGDPMLDAYDPGPRDAISVC